MSFTLRNFTAFRRHLTTNNLQTSLRRSSSKETVSKSICIALSDDPSAIFDYIKKNQESLTGQNCVEALQKLSKCYPQSSRQSKILTEKKDLLMLCNELDKRTKTLNSSQAMEAMQLLFELGVPSGSIIFQSLLKNIHNNIHSLNSENAIELQKILSKLKTSALTKSIKTALSRALKTKGGQTNLNIIALCSNLHKATNEKYLNKELIISILDEISKYPYEISVLTAKSIFISFTRCSEIVVSQFGDLFRRIQDNIIIKASKLECQSVFQILVALIDAQKNNNLSEEFYNEHLIDSLIAPLLSDGALSFDMGIEILGKLRFLGHFQRPLIDYLALKCFENPALISKMKSLQLLQFVSGLTVSDYKPPFWESIHQLIAENKNLKFCSEFTLIRLLCNLAIMDSYPHNLISIAFKISKTQCEETKLSTKQRFGLLYQLVKTLDPNYPGPWPSESVLNIILNSLSHEHLHRQSQLLLSALEKALGGSQYIKSNVETKLGHDIDHVIVMRKGGFPVAINLDRNEANSEYENKSTTFVEDIVTPSESQIITILCMESGSYLRNIKQPRGHIIAYIKSLEAMKYIVIPVYLPEWTNLNDRDKIPFIMNCIRLKCPPDTISVNI